MIPLLASLVATEPVSLQRAFAEAFVRSPEYREAERAYEEAENRHLILLAEQGIVVRYRGDATREFDQDRNLTFTVDVPGLGTEESRFQRLDNRVTLERTLPTGGEIDLTAGIRQTDFSSTTNRPRSSPRSNFEIELTQPLFRANEHRLARERSEQDLLAARADFRSARADLAREVAVRFSGLFTALGESQALRLDLADAEGALEIARGRREAGEATPLEEEEAALAVEETRISLVENEAEILRARGEFEEMTGLRADVLPLESEFSEIVSLPPPPTSFENHPRRVRLARTVEDRRIGLAQTRSRRAPQLDITGRHAWEGDKRTGLTSDFLRSWSAGLRVTVPLYDGSAGRRDITVASSNLESAREELALEEARLEREARHARLSAEVALRRREIGARRTRQTEAEARAAEARYRVGEGTLADLLERRTRLTRARLDEIRSRGEALRSRIEYLSAVGLDPYDALRGR